MSNYLELQTQNAGHESKGMPNSKYHQMFKPVGFHVVSFDFSCEIQSAGGRVIHKLSVICR